MFFFKVMPVIKCLLFLYLSLHRNRILEQHKTKHRHDKGLWKQKRRKKTTEQRRLIEEDGKNRIKIGNTNITSFVRNVYNTITYYNTTMTPINNITRNIDDYIVITNMDPSKVKSKAIP
jgi:hypothetical protein